MSRMRSQVGVARYAELALATAALLLPAAWTFIPLRFAAPATSDSTRSSNAIRCTLSSRSSTTASPRSISRRRRRRVPLSASQIAGQTAVLNRAVARGAKPCQSILGAKATAVRRRERQAVAAALNAAGIEGGASVGRPNERDVGAAGAPGRRGGELRISWRTSRASLRRTTRRRRPSRANCRPQASQKYAPRPTSCNKTKRISR